MNFCRSLAAFVIIFISMASAGFAQAQMRLGHVASDSSPIGQAALRFVDRLSQISNGQLTVSIAGKSSLGGMAQLWVQLRTGALDFHVIDVGAVGLMQEASAIGVIWTPFLFRDQQHYRNFIDSDLFQDQMREIEEKTQVRFIDIIGERSPRIISTTNKAVRTVEDLRGLKIRVPASPIFRKTFEAWGAVPTPTKPTEMFSALKSGMVDGQDNGVVLVANTGLKKVIKHVTPINWSRSAVGLWISAANWRALSTEQQDWINKAARLSRKAGEQAAERDLNAALAALPKLGVTITEPEIDSFKFVTKTVVDEMEGKNWPTGMVQKIQAIQ